ncbi:anaphase-promoting complex subunit 5 isoform X1 [Coffea arabica]|uniref:Anaphase-promoting complex subunit 5 n=2 Tax=Coffea arabica TaxID=13443 RepID=A0A6P6SB53_COFAR|nr:anaphase-promoting complex subunit 5-like [Coffea arabica]XP_027063424.1 anaphase-promoting complex subunit 5-like [Coffea arabica]XP_027063426.1 anaphase-promoting complex subunit 5-like [Coffea arabica]
MAGILKPPGAFTVTPHKVSICILIQVYAPPTQISVPFPFSSVSHHNRLGLFLFALSKSCDGIFEPKLDELIGQLKELGDFLNDWLIDHLTRRLSSLASPDDLFNFFNDLRGILGGSESHVMDDDQIMLDPSSNLGLFVRRCLLSFNLLPFEGVCHLLTNIGAYCKESFSSCPYELSHIEDCANEAESSMEYENMELESLVFDKVSKEFEAQKKANDSFAFHNHAPKAIIGFIEESDISSGSKVKEFDRLREGSSCIPSSSYSQRIIDPQVGSFLRTNWQIQGNLLDQADAIERHGSSFSLNAFESILKQLQKLAPELHRVHFLRYLNSLHHDDYPVALENLHRYFDYSAGTEGIDFGPPSSGCNSFGRYEVALLCLGMMHFHFGHPKQALEVLTEAVRVSQQHSDDACLAYTLAAICNLLSEVGISRMTGIIGSACSSVVNMRTSLSIQQQLFVLLRRSLKRAEGLKLKRLVASNHVAMAKFELTHVQRPLSYFGPKGPMKLRTCPINVCKELRLSSRLIHEFCDESSIMNTDGLLCTMWLKNLKKPIGSVIFSQENESRRNLDTFQFCSQPNSLPGSVVQLLGTSALVRATAWEIYGSASLARISTLAFAACFADSSSSADAALAYAKLIQHLAVFKGHKEAFAALKIAEEKFLCVSKSRVHLVKLQLLHERALHRGDLKFAQRICNEFGALASSVSGVDMELKTEASLRHARTLLAANQFNQAAAVTNSLFGMCYKYNMQVENATVLLLLAEIHKRSGNAALGIPYALASLSFCQSFNLDLLKASATLTLADLWLSLGSNHSKRALALLHSAFPMILGHGGLELSARAYITETKCYLADPSFSVSEDPEVVLEPLKRASEALELLEYHELAVEAFYFLAIVYDKLGYLEEREKAAALFKVHIMALENPEEKEDSLSTML